MKVGILTNSYPPNLNGVSRSVVNLEKSLQKLGIEVFIITPKVPGVVYKDNILALSSYSAPQKVSTDLQVPYNYIDQSVRFIKKNQIDILHSQDTLIGGVEAVIIAMKSKIPCVHTYHTMVEDYDYFSFPGYKTFIRRYSQIVCDGYDAVVAVSPKTENYLYQINVQSPIYQIPNVLILPNSQINNQEIFDNKDDNKSEQADLQQDLENCLENNLMNNQEKSKENNEENIDLKTNSTFENKKNVIQFDKNSQNYSISPELPKLEENSRINSNENFLNPNSDNSQTKEQKEEQKSETKTTNSKTNNFFLKTQKFNFGQKFPNLPPQIENSFNFVTFGRIAKEKSLEIGIEILEPLLQKYPIYYLIAGIGPEMENLQNLIKSKNLENKVFLIGKYDNENLSDFCQFCDIFVNTSTSENLPTTDFEALSFGLPIVAIDDLAHRFFVNNDDLSFLENLEKVTKINESDNYQNNKQSSQKKDLELEKVEKKDNFAINFGFDSPEYTQKSSQKKIQTSAFLSKIISKRESNKLQNEANWLNLDNKPFTKFLEYIQKTQNQIEIQNQKTFQNWFQNLSKLTKITINTKKENPNINKNLIQKQKLNSKFNPKFNSECDLPNLQNNSQNNFQNNLESSEKIFVNELTKKLQLWTNRNQIWVNKKFPKIAELIQKSQENEAWQIGQLNPNIWERKIKLESSGKNIVNLKKELLDQKTKQIITKNTELEQELDQKTTSKIKLEDSIELKFGENFAKDPEIKPKLPNGFCVEIEKMTLCCEKIYLDNNLRQKLSQNARQTAQNLAKRPVELEYQKLYQKLITQNTLEKAENNNKFNLVFENFEELTEKLQNSWQNWLTK